MTDGDKEIFLRNNREYKKLVQEKDSPLTTSRCTPVIQIQPRKTNPTCILCHLTMSN
jgi:hypothetical protein